jgi:hypothetical protein
MINLTNDVPEVERHTALPLVRTPTKGNLRCLVTCHDLIGCYTHWYAGRTKPCQGDTCKPCLEGAPTRWLSYFSARIADGPAHAIVEIPLLAAQQIKEWLKTRSTLREHVITLTRLSKRPNGRVSASIERYDGKEINLPPSPDLIKCLSVIWQVKLAEFSTGPDRHGGRELLQNPDTPSQEADPTHIRQIVGQLPGGNGR